MVKVKNGCGLIYDGSSINAEKLDIVFILEIFDRFAIKLNV